MVHKCCVETCLTIKRPNIVFHRFPLSDPEKLRQWLFTLNMDPKTPRYVLGKLFVCQKHFQPDDYYDVQNLPSRRGRLLKPTAVPTQFTHAHYSEEDHPTNVWLQRQVRQDICTETPHARALSPGLRPSFSDVVFLLLALYDAEDATPTYRSNLLFVKGNQSEKSGFKEVVVKKRGWLVFLDNECEKALE